MKLQTIVFVKDMDAAGDTVLAGIEDLGFGRFIRLADPDGFPVQIAEAPI